MSAYEFISLPVSLNTFNAFRVCPWASVPFPSRATREFPWVFLVPRTFLVQGHYHHWAGGVPSINPRSFKWASIQPSEATEWLKDLNLDHADAEDPVDVGAMSYRLRFMGSILNGNSIPNGNMKLRGLVASVAFLILIVSECLGDLMKNGSSTLQSKAGQVCLWAMVHLGFGPPGCLAEALLQVAQRRFWVTQLKISLLRVMVVMIWWFPRCIVMRMDLMISTCLILSFYFSMCCFLIIHEASMSRFIFF